MKLKYICEICHTPYDSAVKCKECESQPKPRPKFAIGETVFVVSSDVLDSKKPFIRRTIKKVINFNHRNGYILDRKFRKTEKEQRFVQESMRESTLMFPSGRWHEIDKEVIVGDLQRPAFDGELYRIGDRVEIVEVRTPDYQTHKFLSVIITLDRVDLEF